MNEYIKDNLICIIYYDCYMKCCLCAGGIHRWSSPVLVNEVVTVLDMVKLSDMVKLRGPDAEKINRQSGWNRSHIKSPSYEIRYIRHATPEEIVKWRQSGRAK